MAISGALLQPEGSIHHHLRHPKAGMLSKKPGQNPLARYVMAKTAIHGEKSNQETAIALSTPLPMNGHQPPTPLGYCHRCCNVRQRTISQIVAQKLVGMRTRIIARKCSVSL